MFWNFLCCIIPPQILLALKNFWRLTFGKSCLFRKKRNTRKKKTQLCEVSQRRSFWFTLMDIQLIWKIKHQNQNFQSRRTYAHKSYYQLMGFMGIPSDLFMKFTPCHSRWIYYVKEIQIHRQPHCWFYPQSFKWSLHVF